jgi:hypothetical protein
MKPIAGEAITNVSEEPVASIIKVDYPEDGGNGSLRNVDFYLLNYTV